MLKTLYPTFGECVSNVKEINKAFDFIYKEIEKSSGSMIPPYVSMDEFPGRSYQIESFRLTILKIIEGVIQHSHDFKAYPKFYKLIIPKIPLYFKDYELLKRHVKLPLGGDHYYFRDTYMALLVGTKKALNEIKIELYKGYT